MKGLVNHKVNAKELLEQLENLKEGDLKEKEKLEIELNEILNSPEANNISKIMQNAEILVKASGFIENNGKHTFKSEILSSSPSGLIKLFNKYQNTFTDQEYWENLNYVYTIQDYQQIPYEIFKVLFNSTRSKREFLMNEDEREFFEQMPETFTIYRGGAEKEIKTGYGISWTLNKNIAKQFVKRKKLLVEDEIVVLKLKISKSEVVAYFDERKEEEIIYLGK